MMNEKQETNKIKVAGFRSIQDITKEDSIGTGVYVNEYEATRMAEIRGQAQGVLNGVATKEHRTIISSAHIVRNLDKALFTNGLDLPCMLQKGIGLVALVKGVLGTTATIGGDRGWDFDFSADEVAIIARNETAKKQLISLENLFLDKSALSATAKEFCDKVMSGLGFNESFEQDKASGTYHIKDNFGLYKQFIVIKGVYSGLGDLINKKLALSNDMAAPAVESKPKKLSM